MYQDLSVKLVYYWMQMYYLIMYKYIVISYSSRLS